MYDNGPGTAGAALSPYDLNSVRNDLQQIVTEVDDLRSRLREKGDMLFGGFPEAGLNQSAKNPETIQDYLLELNSAVSAMRSQINRF